MCFKTDVSDHGYADWYIAGGYLQLVSMPGYGIDAYLNLKRLEGDWQERHAEPAAPLLGVQDHHHNDHPR